MNVLLVEPDYKNKYPPLGLMKLAYYHKELRGDFVWFQKGQLPDRMSDKVKERIEASKYYTERYADVQQYAENVNDIIESKKWDRIYITTLFTFEWDKTIETIEYAKTLVSSDKIFVGGILATLMADELEAATGIKPTTGLLTCSKMIGFDDSVNIDRITPDYSILDNIEYIYPVSNAYFMSCTKGCGMKCSFCAVQTLEPDYEPYISIVDQVKTIKELYGEKQHLMLMDNNVLKSKSFNKIIDDIIEAGFHKGATYISPITGKPNLRFVDFNQGLDMNFLTAQKAKLLAKTSLRPAHIAFDHYDDAGKYLEAVSVAEENGIDNISSFLLFNTPDFKGKGKLRRADTPEDLYKRARIGVEFAEERNKKRKANGKNHLHLYSFPMEYIPLGAKKRKYIGENWSCKTLQAAKRIIHISKGSVFPGSVLFESTWGKTTDEYLERLQMPKLFIEQGLAAYAAMSSKGTRDKKPKHNMIWAKALAEWQRLFRSLDEYERQEFIKLISSAEFTIDIFSKIKSKKLRQLYIHYFTATQFVEFLKELEKDHKFLFWEAVAYLISEGVDVVKANQLYLSELKCGDVHNKNLSILLDMGLEKNRNITRVFFVVQPPYPTKETVRQVKVSGS